MAVVPTIVATAVLPAISGIGPKALFRWAYSREEHYVQLLLDTIKEGQRVENSWKPQVYTDIIASFKTNGFGVVTRAQLNNEPNSTAQ
jgi:hypothetical protein